ncbi:hypothetical protein THAOC_30318 [Thalassiosira oceanica]|uniref:Uncharacterized protein n=1 Tax=Thalassiosira oceanica TaxID=159749 RepID=K0REJ7_THAOC|nr:hypothetical protein THAOC_30318 [Thalassiosira oceanica]|eukprot:EJK50644.1 hypothetical protein THAOC_30318 [Thalassiosira oceanica]
MIEQTTRAEAASGPDGDDIGPGSEPPPHDRFLPDGGRWTVDAGRWTLDAGRWALDPVAATGVTRTMARRRDLSDSSRGEGRSMGVLLHQSERSPRRGSKKDHFGGRDYTWKDGHRIASDDGGRV